MAMFRRITNLLSRGRMDADIERELKAHLEMRIEDNLAAGMPREAARRDAMMRFGNPALMKERTSAADAICAVHEALPVTAEKPGGPPLR